MKIGDLHFFLRAKKMVLLSFSLPIAIEQGKHLTLLSSFTNSASNGSAQSIYISLRKKDLI